MAKAPITNKPVQSPAPQNNRGGRGRKCPLRLHSTGQWCKDIRGKRHYFGTDKAAALERYYALATELHGGTPSPGGASSLTVRDLCNLYLHHQKAQETSGSLTHKQFYLASIYLGWWAKYAGPDRPASEIKAIDLQLYRTHLINANKAPNTVNNYLARVKAMFNWALNNEVLTVIPNLHAVKRVHRTMVDRQVFNLDELKALLGHAEGDMRAMILLGINCGFGETDCAFLRWENLDLSTGRADYPRIKTGVPRRPKLWDETIAELRAVQARRRRTAPACGDLVFYTKYGHPWIRACDGDKRAHDNALTKEFSKLMKRAGVPKRVKGTGFYSLRRTGATMLAKKTGDVFAVQGFLGHADTTQASTYVQMVNLLSQTDLGMDKVLSDLRGILRCEGSSDNSEDSSGGGLVPA